MSTNDRIILLIDASHFQRKVGELVRKGEMLGLFQGNPIIVPFEGRIHSVSFDSDEHVLQVVLVEGSK